MTYVAGSLIVASDYNFVKDTLNGLWSTGSGSSGYGQTAISPSVSVGSLITASGYWATVVDNLRCILTHQGTAYSPMTTPSAGSLITALPNLFDNYNSAASVNNRFNSVSSSITFNGVTNSTVSFNETQTMTHTVSFGSHDQARYFFNSGGQFNISVYQPSSPLSTCASNLGSIRFGAGDAGTGTQTIAGVSYTGTAKVGGAMDAYSVLNTSTNFYNITASETILAAQGEAGSTASVYVYVSYNNAGALTFKVVSYAPSTRATMSAGGTLNIQQRDPHTSACFLNTWGVVTTTSTSVTQTSVAVAQWYFFATSSIIQVPAGTTSARIITIGGGGCGETATGLTIKGGGGGGAGQIVDRTTAVQAGGYITCIIGAGGQGFDGYAGNGGTTATTHLDTQTSIGGTRGGQDGNVLGQGGKSGSGYTGGQAYIYGRQVYAGGGGGGNNYYGFNAAQSGTVFQGEGGVGGTGVTIGPINGNYYNVGGGGQGGMNRRITNWTLADETGYKYGGGLGGAITADGGNGVAGTGGGGGGGAQTTILNGTEPIVGGNGGSGFVAIYM